MQAFRITLGVIGGLLLLLVLSAALLLATAPGARVALWSLGPILPDGITVGAVDGRLLGPLLLRDVSVETEGMVVDVAAVALRWAPMGLARGHLEIEDLMLEGVRYRARPTEDAGGEPGLQLPDRIDLPVSVAVRRLRVADVEIVTGPDQQEPLVLDRILLAGRFAESRLEIDALELHGPALAVTAQAELLAAGAYPLTARADWRVELPDFPPLIGATRLEGTVDALRLTQDLDAPYNARVAGQIHDLLAEDGAPRLELSATVDDLQLADLGELPDARVSLAASATGPLDALEIQVEAAGEDPLQRRFEAELRALIEPEGVLLRRLVVTQPGRPGALRGKGRIALGGDLSADLVIAWEALQWPLTGEPTLESPRGSLRLVGPPDDYTFQLDARIEPLGQPPLDLVLRGEGGRDAAEFVIDAEVAAGRLDGNVTLTVAPDIRIAVDLNGQGLDPSVLAAEWPGSIDFELAGTARLGDAAIDVNVPNLRAQGRLRGEPMSISAGGEYAQRGEDRAGLIERFELVLGSSRANASGRLGEAFDLTWSAASDDLSELLPEARGRVDGAGTVTGTYPELRIDADLQGQQLALGEARVERLRIVADVDLTGARESVVELTATAGSVAGVDVQRVELRGRGRPADHDLRVTLAADGANAAFVVNGGMDEPWHDSRLWRFEVREARLEYRELPPLRLAQNAAGLVGPDRIRVGRHCWQAADAALCLEAVVGSEQFTARADLTGLEFDYFATLAPDDLRITGAIDGSMQVSRSDSGALVGEVEMRSTAGEIVLPPRAETGVVGSVLPAVRFEPSRVSAQLGEQEAHLRAALNLQYGRFLLEATTPAAVVTAVTTDLDQQNGDLASQPLTGILEVDVPDLSFADQLIPAIARAEGSIGGRLELNGTLGAPAPTGTLALRDGAATLNDARVRITDVTVSLEGRGRDGIALEAMASSGGGDVRASGMLRLFGEAATAVIDIEGREFEILNTDDARIFASPDLRMEADQERVAVSGEVRVPRARITPGRRTEGAVTVSQDQVLVGAEPDVDVAPRDLYADIRLIPGDEVFFSGFGLDARIEGDVRVVETPGSPTTATGELRLVDGEYRAYGQGLVIERGRIFFAGPVTEPGVDIEAVRRPREGILVGARVRGTLDEPEFSLFSDPTMPEQEQLAYLVLGRPLDEAPGGEGSALAQAALALGLRGGDALAQNIGGRLGVDELTIATGPDEAGAESDSSQASLVVGTYLSPRLYVSYGIGLFQPGSVLQVQYDISRRWRLVTRSGAEEAGADLLFTLERGRD